MHMVECIYCRQYGEYKFVWFPAFDCVRYASTKEMKHSTDVVAHTTLWIREHIFLLITRGRRIVRDFFFTSQYVPPKYDTDRAEFPATGHAGRAAMPLNWSSALSPGRSTYRVLS